MIGVVADYASAPVEQRLPQPKLFLRIPAGPDDNRNVRVVVRGPDPAALVRPVRRALGDVSGGAVVTTAYTIRQILTVQNEEMLVGTAPFVPLIVIGMMLTASGIYGVLAFAIARRSREIAVRVAIGAGRADQIRLVTSHSLRLVGLGLACGTGVTFALSRVVRAAGGAGAFYDPPWLAFVVPVAVVLVVSALATWLPTPGAAHQPGAAAPVELITGASLDIPFAPVKPRRWARPAVAIVVRMRAEPGATLSIAP